MPIRARAATFAVALCAALLAPLLPAVLPGPKAIVDSVVHSIPLAALTGGVRTSTVALTGGDRLLGVTWRHGQPKVAVRWHTSAGWSAWEVADNDSAAPTAAERARAVPGTEPLWRPRGADRAQLRLSGAGTGLDLVHVADAAARRVGGILGLAPAQAAEGEPLLGHVYTRQDWGADESLRHQPPAYAGSVQAVVVHHTAQPNDYSAADVPAMIRADYVYHVRTRGWNDIGYNLLVDKFGRIWQGRYGGIDRAVVGAQAEGFNAGTLGVAVLGDMTQAAPTAATLAALERIGAFAAVTWGFDPLGSVLLRSAGSPRFAAGQLVRLPRLLGHRDTGLTACPGQQLYARLNQLRAGAFGMLGAAPRWLGGHLTGSPLSAPGPLGITVRANRPVYWTIVVTGPGGVHVAEATGVGSTARLSWNGLTSLLGKAGAVRLPALPGIYRYAATAVDGFHPQRPVYRGTLTVGVPNLDVLGHLLR